MNKNFYYSLGLLMAQTFVFGQEYISFEAHEGYTLGSLNTQNNWEITDDNQGNFLSNQIVTNEQKKDGDNSYKNGHQDDYNPQWFPIFGASKTFDTPYDYNNFTISYDIFITQRNGADFEFNLYGIDAEANYVPVVGIGFENRGYVYVTTSVDYDFEYADDAANFALNTWHNVKIEVSSEEIKYYFNNQLVYTTDNFTQTEIKGITMLHNNYGGSAYYDNFKINDHLSTNDIVANQLLITPNPVKDQLNINFNGEVSSIEIMDLLGRSVAKQENTTIDLKHLTKGNYIAKITLKDGKVITRKFIKK
ncbi:T9SS type A sorting domain-containing protein [Faecalibacter bovis]|uniref:T9SS type A sorting domain-containing protein n=1 Tax=Faecalibacter bovis TaxID=2898187 RepID=A0ABX7X9T8_9FLAO|nr:T9SS type A sorting domain-containing protein [Faecalibacter bovis]QTV04643.1 T9SS type A sorting domain-containing protein [Faecalibacter bovis]